MKKAVKKSLKKVKKFLIDKYGNNLAAIILFGSANTGEFREKESDIDTIILLKKNNELDLKKEAEKLFKEMNLFKLSVQNMATLQQAKEKIKRRRNWSTYITILGKGGCKIIYSTPEFEKLKCFGKKNAPIKKRLKEYLLEKDKFELEGYFKKRKGFDLTKGLMSHIRRKLQIINYFKTKKLIFSYKKCLRNIKFQKKEKKELKKLYKQYRKRIPLSENEIDYYYNIANKLTKIIEKL